MPQHCYCCQAVIAEIQNPALDLKDARLTQEHAQLFNELVNILRDAPQVLVRHPSVQAIQKDEASAIHCDACRLTNRFCSIDLDVRLELLGCHSNARYHAAS